MLLELLELDELELDVPRLDELLLLLELDVPRLELLDELELDELVP